jgi:hypothetical protein
MSWAGGSSSSSTGQEQPNYVMFLLCKVSEEYGAFGGFSLLKYHILK